MTTLLLGLFYDYLILTNEMGKVNKLRISFRAPNFGLVTKFCGILGRFLYIGSRIWNWQQTENLKKKIM